MLGQFRAAIIYVFIEIIDIELMRETCFKQRLRVPRESISALRNE